MVITEEELREAWRNGSGALPELPPDARLTPAAADFLASRGLKAVGPPLALQCAAPGPGPSPGGAADSMELVAPPGKRLILTAQDVEALLEGGRRRFLLHASVTITDAAKERLRAAGARILPFVEAPAQPAAGGPQSQKDELFERVRAAVLARVDVGADKTVLDAVIRSVLGSL
jgi:hypothetical protein